MVVWDVTVSDVELVAAVVGRDRAAFVALFERYAPRVKGYLRAGGLDEGRSEELTQEVMLRMWQLADRYDPARASVATWIYTIARNLRIDVLRREGRPDPEPWSDATEVLPDDLVERAREAKRIDAAVAELPAEQAEVVRDAYLGDHSLRAVADRQGVPLGTVKGRARLALQRLRKALGGVLDDP